MANRNENNRRGGTGCPRAQKTEIIRLMLVRGLLFLLGARKPKAYSDVAEIIHEEGVLNGSERESFRKMTKFRNL